MATIALTTIAPEMVELQGLFSNKSNGLYQFLTTIARAQELSRAIREDYTILEEYHIIIGDVLRALVKEEAANTAPKMKKYQEDAFIASCKLHTEVITPKTSRAFEVGYTSLILANGSALDITLSGKVLELIEGDTDLLFALPCTVRVLQVKEGRTYTNNKGEQVALPLYKYFLVPASL